MGLSEAREIVRTLANGIDPTTGEVLAPHSPYNDPDVIRALFVVHESCRTTKDSRKSLDERRRENEKMGRPRNAGLPWTEETRNEVAAGFKEGRTFDDLAAHLERSASAVRLELIKQGLVESEDGRV